MSFSEKLQKLRKMNGLSQEGLADLLDVTRQSVSKWESGQTYPEMDKLLSMCKIFKCSLDDLTNDEITDIKIEVKKKSSIYTFIDSIIDFVQRIYHIFTVMTRKERIKCILTIIVIALILLIFRIPFLFVEDIFYSILKGIIVETHIVQFGSNIVNFFIDCCYYSLYIVVLTYIFKIIYLENDIYKNRQVTKQEEVIVEEQEEKIPIVKEKKDNKKINISQKADNFFHFLGVIATFFSKAIICFLMLPLVVVLFLLCASLLIVLYLLFKGVCYISVLIGIPFAILFTLTILEILISFVVCKKTNVKRTLILFFVSIIGLGSSFGILLLDIASITYIDNIPTEVQPTLFTRNYEMTDDFYFLFNNQIEYVIDNHLEKELRLEVEYYEDYTEIQVPPEMNASGVVFEKQVAFINQKYVELIIHNMAKRIYYDYGKLYDAKIKVYTSEENIRTLKNNYEKEMERQEIYHEEEERNYYLDEIKNYQNQIAELENEKDGLNTTIAQLQEKNEQLQNSVEDYKNKIEEYKNRLQAMIEE